VQGLLLVLTPFVALGWVVPTFTELLVYFVTMSTAIIGAGFATSVLFLLSQIVLRQQVKGGRRLAKSHPVPS
jgi:hypothetical protein